MLKTSNVAGLYFPESKWATPDERVFSFLQDVCGLLKHASRLVPHSQEHLVIKFCQLVHHLLNQLKVPTPLLFLLRMLTGAAGFSLLTGSCQCCPQVIMDEQTLDVLVKYTTGALRVCSVWTHSDILLALSAVVYGNGPHCYQVAAWKLNSSCVFSTLALKLTETSAAPR